MANLVGQSDVTAYTSNGQANGNSGTKCHALAFVASTTGTATAIYFYARLVDGSNYKFFITDNSGNRLALTSAVAEADGWISGSISSTTITSGNTYYLGWYVDTTDTGYGHFYHNSATEDQVDSTSGTYTSPPSTFSFSSDFGDNKFAIYADGTAGGGGSPTATIAWITA